MFHDVGQIDDCNTKEGVNGTRKSQNRIEQT